MSETITPQSPPMDDGQAVHDPVASANQRENAAAVLLKELDQRQDSVLEDLDQLNGDIENLIESWRMGEELDGEPVNQLDR